MVDFDAVIVGAGIAGVSLARELSRDRSVALVEREITGAAHSTGRSAALYIHPYGTPTMCKLASASLPFLLRPPKGFAPTPLMSPRALLWLARADQVTALDQILDQSRAAGGTPSEYSGSEAAARWPILDQAYLAGGKAALDEGAFDIDVHALHSAFLRAFTTRGGTSVTSAEVSAIERCDDHWRVRMHDRDITARIVINAAGAWADQVAILAGARPVGLQPMRRTMVMLPSLGVSTADWPCFIDTSEEFYFKPEGESLLVSPADETPVEPGDVQPEEIDIATAVDRLERATTIGVRRIGQRWAGLRTFAADHDPVIGWDPRIEGFFWLAGQGGAGIMTSPAIARLAAALLEGKPVPDDLAAIGIDAERVSPHRFALHPA